MADDMVVFLRFRYSFPVNCAGNGWSFSEGNRQGILNLTFDIFLTN